MKFKRPNKIEDYINDKFNEADFVTSLMMTLYNATGSLPETPERREFFYHVFNIVEYEVKNSPLFPEEKKNIIFTNLNNLNNLIIDKTKNEDNKFN
jgi:hypothetical protein